MPLPTLPNGLQRQIYDGMVRHLPGKWFHLLESEQSPIYPILWGTAFAMAHVQNSWTEAMKAAIPIRSGGPWLSLHLKGLGLTRRPDETDAAGRDRYQWEFKPTRNTRAGELAALSHYLNLEPPTLRLETDRASGRFGQFRVVADSDTLNWSEVEFNFIGEFIRRYVTNGIVPGINITFENVNSIKLIPLPVWRYYTQFYASYTAIGPFWERPIFLWAGRLDFARHLIVQAEPATWRSQRDSLLRLFQSAVGDGGFGTFFYFLTDTGKAPYFEATYALNLTTADINQTFPARKPIIGGWRYYNKFPIYGPSTAAIFIVPFLEAPAALPVQITSGPTIAPLNLLELNEIFDPFPGETASSTTVYKYYGLSFAIPRVVGWYPVAAINTGGAYTSANLNLLRSGPWTLALTEGNPLWGDFPPQASTLEGAVFSELKPASVWYTDAAGTARSWTPLWDGQSIYMAAEFLLPKGSDRTVREIELRLNGSRVHYRRLSIPLSREINGGFIARVKAS